MMPIQIDIDKCREKFSLQTGKNRLNMERIQPQDSDSARLRLYHFLEDGDIAPIFKKKDFEHFFLR